SDKLIGIETFLSRIYKTSVLQYEEIISNFTGIIPCTVCAGSRLRKEALYVYVADKNMADLLKLSIDYFGQWIDGLTFSSYENKIADRIIKEIQNRVKTLKKVGLHYLTLNRSSDTLSGGESQRIYLTKNLNSNLANSLYILDEPSIGLHPKDSENLIQVLQELRDLKNTVLVVEHDQFIIKSADYIIELGPQAAQHGGNIVAQGSPQEIITINNSLTAKLFKDEIHPKIVKKKELIHFFMLSEANSHNLKNISCQFPLEALTVVCGVSGSGKSTLIKIDLIESLEKVFKKNHNHIYDWSYKKKKVNSSISGNYSMIKDFVLVDQKSIGRSSRSSPITYIGGFDAIRYIFSSTPLAKQRKYYATYFSFNTDGGRCEDCLGEGVKTIEMQFLSDINVVCETCKGKKFKDEILEVEYKNKNIHDILTMTVDEAIDFFTNDKNVVDLITPLKEVGLGYLKLGQNSMTLSGGEAQRIKLATYLLPSKSKTIPYLFIFDEPTTGLHSLDITNLLTSFQKLIKQGHTIICIEHNTDVINAADWVIEIGPEGGQNGGNLIFEGTLANLKKFTNSITAKYL
ncbi:MAG: ATP-binding cassette domain-containing protein, partial [Sediminibacterium sp.]|nr:ATP-binding cassette domain-containing protein [Sediminibacterium sp.]